MNLAVKYAERDLDVLAQAVALTPGRRSVVQAGGNLGVFARALAKSFVVVYSFEPDPDNFREMAKNVQEWNVVKMQIALGAGGGPVNIRTQRRDGSGKPVHAGLAHVDGAGMIPQIRLDDLNLAVVDLLVLDLEGYELRALVGASKTVARCRPVIMVEINKHCRHYGIEEDDVRTWLRMVGYTLVRRVNSDEIWIRP